MYEHVQLKKSKCISSLYPQQTKLGGGYTNIALSVRLSVHIVLDINLESMSYLHGQGLSAHVLKCVSGS